MDQQDLERRARELIGSVDEMDRERDDGVTFIRDDKARPALGHLPIPPSKRIEREKLPAFPTIDDAYKITGRMKTTTVDVVREPDGDWYVIKTNPNCECRAMLAIENRLGVRTFAPDTTIWHKVARRNGRSRKVRRNRRLLPGYAFIRLVGEKPPFGAVRDCDGVLNFVYEDGRPGMVPETVIAELYVREQSGDFDCTKRRQERENTSVLPSVWRWIFPGARGVVDDGPFASFPCLVESVDMARFRAKVGVSIFGQMTPVELEFDQILRA